MVKAVGAALMGLALATSCPLGGCSTLPPPVSQASLQVSPGTRLDAIPVADDFEAVPPRARRAPRLASVAGVDPAAVLTASEAARRTWSPLASTGALLASPTVRVRLGDGPAGQQADRPGIVPAVAGEPTAKAGSQAAPQAVSKPQDGARDYEGTVSRLERGARTYGKGVCQGC